MRRSPPACTKRLARRRAHHATSRCRRSAIAMRGSRPSQSETAILPSESCSGGSVCCVDTSRPAASSHCVTVSGAKAEPAMGVLVAQEFEIVRREIDDQQPPGRAQHARRLARSRARRRRGSAAPGG